MLTEQFISVLDDEGMISEFLREVLMLEDIENVTSKGVLLWTQRVEVQKVQTKVLNNIKEAKDFDLVRHSTPKHDNETQKNQKRVDNCKHCETGLLSRWSPACSKIYGECIWLNHLKAVCRLIQLHQVDCRPLRVGRAVHEVRQDGEE